MVKEIGVSINTYFNQCYTNTKLNTVIPPKTNSPTMKSRITTALKLNLAKAANDIQNRPLLSTIPTNVIAKADSGASRHYFTMKDKHALHKLKHLVQGPQVGLPNGTYVSATEAGHLPLHPTLTSLATKTHVFPELTSSSLISIGQLCDDDCTAILNKQDLKIYKNGHMILQGHRNLTDGLWDVHLRGNVNNVHHTINHVTEPTEKMNIIIRRDKTKSELAQYLHACAFSPALSTFQKSIRKGHFITWPGITNINFEKTLVATTPSAKGHLDQERQNLQSTKTTIQQFDEDQNPTPTSIKTNECMSLILPFNAKTTSYTDLTGRFPYKSTSGNEYLYVMYDYDSNAIMALPIKNRQAKTLTTAWNTLQQNFTRTGHTIKHFVMDNEISFELRTALKKYNYTFELTPPHMHRRNAAERAIRTYKSHLLAGIATCHPDFPLTEWDRLIDQCNLTINLLRTSRINPNLSAYAYLNGNFDFNAHPLAPPGTKVVIHKKPNDRTSWQYHGTEAWYIGPSLEHYRCFKCFIPATGAIINTDTVKMIPHMVPIPNFTDAIAVQQAIADILHIIKNSSEVNIPKFWKGDAIQQAFQNVADALNQQKHKTTPVHNPPAASPPTKQTQPPSQLSPLPSPIPIPPRPVTPSPTSPTSPLPPIHRPLPRVIPPAVSTPIHAALPRVPQQPPLTHNFLQQPYIIPKSPFPKIWAPTPSHIWNPSMVAFHIFNKDGKKQSIDDLIKGPTQETWLRSTANELGRLAKGIPDRVRGTECIEFIPKHKVPQGKKVTYANMVCDYRPLKDEPYRVRLTIGGDKLDYFDDTASPAASLLETKILINSVISDAHHGARFLGIDIKDFFLLSYLPPDQKEYMRIHSRYFDDEFRKLYNITPIIAEDGYVYCEIQRGMYGLKQAAILAYNQLKDNLSNHGYFPIPNSTGLWKHETRPTIFALCVDDFGVKYLSEDDANHLINTLKKYYPISLDKKGTNYCGLTLHWNYREGYVDVDMPDYVTKKLNQYQHPHPNKPQYAPHQWTRPAYGKATQYAPEPDKTELLDSKGQRLIQSIVGTFLYYGRAIDPTILPALNEISTQQSRPTKKTLAKTNMLLDYMATYPNARMRFLAGTMQLLVESDAAYLVLPNAKSRFAGHYMLASKPNIHNQHKAPLNAPILIECKTIKNVVCSAAEAECGGLFYNGQMAKTIRQVLTEMGHPQQATQLKTDNKTANDFVHASMRMKRSKTWDMRYHWLRQEKIRNILKIMWDKGTNNLADYFTKHHPPAHHRIQRYKYILKGFNTCQKLQHQKNSTFWARVYSTTMDRLATKLLTQKLYTYI